MPTDSTLGLAAELTLTDFIQASDFGQIAELVCRHAAERPGAIALRDDAHSLDWQALDALMDRVAARLQQDDLGPGDAIAVCADASVRYAALFLGALRAGVAVAPLPPNAEPSSLARMVQDAGALWLFLDSGSRKRLAHVPEQVRRVSLLQDADEGETPWEEWLAAPGGRPQPVVITAATPFNIIYSSGTTGDPKGIVQPHGMRWGHVRRVARYGYGPGSVTLLATPLYSNTTLVSFFPTLAYGGCVCLNAKFDAARYLQQAEDLRATHTMLVPVQYQRLLAHPQFAATDLSAFQVKFCTSAPFSAALKAQVLARWPGGLVEFYGMTEGGGTCILDAHLHPHKLHTVGRPAEGSDLRLIDEQGRELPPGLPGEVVGHSASMMTGYHCQPEKTREAEWFDAAGKRFIRTGDVGRFDEDGFLTLLDRRKDMVISGGFNIYPSDLEAVLLAHPAVSEAAVVGLPSPEWGETPAAFVVLRKPSPSTEDLRAWANARLGKTQRISRLCEVQELPRNAIGKVMKRELRSLLIPVTGASTTS